MAAPDFAPSALRADDPLATAITAARAAVAAAPRSSAAQLSLAKAYLAAAMVPAAQRAVDAAVKLAPRNGEARYWQAFAHSHNDVGVLFGVGFERDQALKATRAAAKRLPKDLAVHELLAKLQERDGRGWPYEAGADLRGAVAAWRRVFTLAPNEANGLALVHALLHSEQASQAEIVLRGLEPSALRDRWLVASVTVAHGADAGRALQQSLGSTAPSDSDVARACLSVRAYPCVRTFFEQALVVLRVPVSAKLQRKQAKLTPEIHAVIDGLIDVAYGQPRAPLFPRVRSRGDERTMVELAAKNLRAEKLPAVVVRDLLGALPWTVDLGANGTARVSVDGRDFAFFYVVPHAGRARVVVEQADLAGFVDDRVRQQDLASARALVSFIRVIGASYEPQRLDAISISDGFGLQLWTAMSVMRLDADALPLYERCYSDRRVREMCDALAGVALLDAGRDQEALRHVEAATARGNGDPVERTRVRVLSRLGKRDEVEALIVAEPDLHKRAIKQIDAAAGAKDRARAFALGEALLRKPNAETAIHNNTAWMAAGVPPLRSRGREIMQALITRLRAKPVPSADDLASMATYYNTQATLEAMDGHLAHAIEANRLERQHKDARSPTSGDWVTWGMMAERLGLLTDAIAAYRRVPAMPFDETGSLAEIAEQRLQALGAAPSAKR